MEFNLAESLQLLSKTPGVLSLLLSGLPENWIKNNEGPDTWSPYDVVGHLIHGEKTDWIPRAQRILSENPTVPFTPFDRFAQFEESKGKTLPHLLQEFSTLRKKNLEVLESMGIDNAMLERKGIHPEFGEVKLKELLATWAVHDLSHINQLTRVMLKNYRKAVGPWAKYISLLRKEEK